MTETAHLKSLGKTTQYAYDKPDASLLEKFESPFKLADDNFLDDCRVKITAPEFTSLCPITGQPDFAEIYIEYIPRDFCVESKSLKLYLGSFRMHGEFHESCTNRIAQDLSELLDPLYIKVEGRFSPRGGIKFWPVVEFHRE
jgi:7-cyano-7-deazaguanine reductase